MSAAPVYVFQMITKTRFTTYRLERIVFTVVVKTKITETNYAFSTCFSRLRRIFNAALIEINHPEKTRNNYLFHLYCNVLLITKRWAFWLYK